MKRRYVVTGLRVLGWLLVAAAFLEVVVLTSAVAGADVLADLPADRVELLHRAAVEVWVPIVLRLGVASFALFALAGLVHDWPQLRAGVERRRASRAAV